MNRPWLLVHRRPRVAILPTGDEVVMPGDPVGPNQIVSSNALGAGGAGQRLRRRAGAAADRARRQRSAAAHRRGRGRRRSAGHHRRRLGRRARSRARRARRRPGSRSISGRVAMRPGKPLMVGRYRDTPMIGLPGNPVSTLVCGLLFVKPAIERLLGLDAMRPEPTLTARLAVPARRKRPAPGLSARDACRAPPTARSRPSLSRCRTAR